MRFLADVGISPGSLGFLRNQGYEAVHLHELGLGRLPDGDIMEKARREDYVVLTHDLGFGELLALTGAELPTVVIFRLKSMRPSSLNQYLQILITEHHGAMTKGAILSVSEQHIRVRTLPIAE